MREVTVSELKPARNVEDQEHRQRGRTGGLHGSAEDTGRIRRVAAQRVGAGGVDRGVPSGGVQLLREGLRVDIDDRLLAVALEHQVDVERCVQQAEQVDESRDSSRNARMHDAPRRGAGGVLGLLGHVGTRLVAGETEQGHEDANGRHVDHATGPGVVVGALPHERGGGAHGGGQHEHEDDHNSGDHLEESTGIIENALLVGGCAVLDRPNCSDQDAQTHLRSGGRQRRRRVAWVVERNGGRDELRATVCVAGISRSVSNKIQPSANERREGCPLQRCHLSGPVVHGSGRRVGGADLRQTGADDQREHAGDDPAPAQQQAQNQEGSTVAKDYTSASVFVPARPCAHGERASRPAEFLRADQIMTAGPPVPSP